MKVRELIALLEKESAEAEVVIKADSESSEEFYGVTGTRLSALVEYKYGALGFPYPPGVRAFSDLSAQRLGNRAATAEGIDAVILKSGWD